MSVTSGHCKVPTSAIFNPEERVCGHLAVDLLRACAYSYGVFSVQALHQPRQSGGSIRNLKVRVAQREREYLLWH